MTYNVGMATTEYFVTEAINKEELNQMLSRFGENELITVAAATDANGTIHHFMYWRKDVAAEPMPRMAMGVTFDTRPGHS